MIEIDGSGGGGQILRTALGLSVVTDTPFEMENIRGDRRDPGLKTQHLEGLRGIAELCNAELEGDSLGSREIVFEPNEITKERLEIGIETAGAVGLVFQTLQLVPFRLEKEVKVLVDGGATYGKWAPPCDYISKVFLPVMERFGYGSEMRVIEHGFYPKGGAEVEIGLKPWEGDRPTELEERGERKDVRIMSTAAEDLRGQRVADRQAEACKEILTEGGIEAEAEVLYVDSLNPGSGIVCWCEFEGTVMGGDAVGERGVRSEEVGQKAAEGLVESLEAGGCVDRWTADMIIPLVALAGGRVRVPEVTDHIRTNLETAREFLDTDIELDGKTVKTSIS